MLQTIFRSRTLSIVLARRTFTYRRRIEQRHNDNIDLNHQTVEIDPVQRIRRCSFYKDIDIYSFYKRLSPNVRTLGDALQEGCLVSQDGPCIGIHACVDDPKSLQWLSYSQVLERSQRIGSYLWSETKLQPMHSKVAILSSNRAEYLFVEQGSYMYGFVVVSLYTTYDATTITDILKRTQAEVLVVENLERVQSMETELVNNDQIKEIIVLDDIDERKHRKIQSLSSILARTKNSKIHLRPVVDPDSVAAYVLTSGTTGEPKIAMISHENLLATAKGNLIRLDHFKLKDAVTKRHCSFLPMAHIFEQLILLQSLLCGTQLVFCPAPEKLPAYLSAVKPTQLAVVPRVLNRVYDVVMTEVNKSALKRFLVRQALREQPPFLAHLLFRKLRNLFGGEAKGAMTGAAPISPDVMHFFRIALGIPIMEGYGQTESSGAGTCTHPVDMSYGSIGSPVATVEIKLIDVPTTDYRSENNQGEVCIRGPTVFKGYYDDEAKTREALGADGWLRTGDVGEWTTAGALRIIDRTKHIFKLSQGEHIAPERLEDAYLRSPWVAQIFVDGLPTEQAVVAVVVPDEEYVRQHYQSAVVGELCKDEKLKAIILADLIRFAERHQLKSYETVGNIHLHAEPFSQNNGLLTVTLKTRRTNARQRFQPIIESLYTNGARNVLHTTAGVICDSAAAK